MKNRMTETKFKVSLITIAWVLAFILIATALAACGSGGASTDASTDGTVQKNGDGTSANKSGTLIYGSGDYTSINPALYEHGEINSLLFAGLTAHNEKNEVVPGLAESWDYDADALTYTFRLRDGLKFHDGKPLTAEDVKFTLDTIMDEKNGSEIISNYEEIESVTAEDELTAVIKLKTPCVAMPDYLTIGILPKHLLEGENVAESGFNQNPVGAGPYKLKEWDMGQSITMEKFDGFCLGTPKIDTVVFKIVKEDGQRALQLKTGELTLAQVTPKDAEEFKRDEAFTVYDMDTADYRGIMYNFNNPFWAKNRELPAALSYAIDRKSIVASVLLGDGQTAWSPLQKGPYANDAIEKYDYDPEKAKRAIEVAGWKPGSGGYYEKDGQELGFEISVRPSDQVRVDMANIAAQNLQDIGVNAVVAVNENTDWENQSAFLIGWGSPFDPDDHTYKVFGTGKGANYGFYSNREVDRILAAARATEDTEKRAALYKEFQKAFAQDPAYTFIAYIDALYVAKSGLSGITADTPLGHHGVGIFWNVYEWELRKH